MLYSIIIFLNAEKECTHIADILLTDKRDEIIWNCELSVRISCTNECLNVSKKAMSLYSDIRPQSCTEKKLHCCKSNVFVGVTMYVSSTSHFDAVLQLLILLLLYKCLNLLNDCIRHVQLWKGIIFNYTYVWLNM